jgi:HAD superfamily hydrolase (TIGR01509 family)
MLKFKPVIIFDMDGVLFDSEPLHCQFEEGLFRQLNITPSAEQKKLFVGLGDLRFWELLKEMFNLKETVEKLILFDRRERIKFFRDHEAPVMKGAQKLLEHLSNGGFRMAIASSSLMEIIDGNLARSELAGFFEIKVCNDMITNGKPDPDIFLMAAGKMNASPDQCVVIEDSEHGTKAAKSAGMKCIALKNDPASRQDVSRADLVVSGLNKITADSIHELFA